jgi:hypothetical protein
MKRITVALAAALLLTSIAFAQQSSPAQTAPGPAPQAAPQAMPQAMPLAAQAQGVKVSGKLELIDGAIGIRSSGKVHYVMRINRLIGFVKDLQEGAVVTVEGYERTLPYSNGASMLIATKLSFGGKDYELGNAGRGFKGPGQKMREGMMGSPRDCPRW